jgi:hypothetical protein
MLINFFKNIFPIKIISENENTDPGYHLYKKLNLKNKDRDSKLYYLLDNDPSMCDTLLDDCLKHAIDYNDLPLVEKLYPYMKRYHREVKKDRKDHLLFHYATMAMEANKIDIFDYFIHLYQDKHRGICYVAEFSPWEFTHLIDLMIDSKKIHYFNILENYDLFNCHNYLASHISGRVAIVKDNNHIVNFMLDNFPIKSHNENSYIAMKGNGIDINKLLLEACKSENPEKELILNLVNRGADLNYRNGLCLEFIIEKQNLDMTMCLLEKGAKINLDRISPHNSLYPWLEKWIESQELFDDLNREIGSNDSRTIQSKKNKL